MTEEEYIEQLVRVKQNYEYPCDDSCEFAEINFSVDEDIYDDN